MADEKEETARFDVLHELERSYDELTRALESVECACRWSELDGLHGAVGASRSAIERAEALHRDGCHAEAGGRAHIDASPSSSAAAALEKEAEGAEETLETAAADDEAEGEEEDELLSQMVAAQAKRTRRQQLYRGGSGGGKGKGARNKAKGRA